MNNKELDKKPIFTILMPVIRPPDLMVYAINSVQKQTVTNFELFIIGDGAPKETIDVAKEFAERDPRIKVFPYPKGERNGELNRHNALDYAQGEYVCHLCDDDLWFPEHLYYMNLLLKDADFGNTLHTFIEPEGSCGSYMYDLSDPQVQKRMLTSKWNFFGHSVAGYRLATYRQLLQGWSPAPQDVWPDLYMWRKFLSHEGVRARTSFHITAIQFKSPQRTDWTPSQRKAEIEHYSELIANELARERIMQEVFRSNFQFDSDGCKTKVRELESHVENIESLNRQQLATINEILSSRSWRLSHPIRVISRSLRQVRAYSRRIIDLCTNRTH